MTITIVTNNTNIKSIMLMWPIIIIMVMGIIILNRSRCIIILAITNSRSVRQTHWMISTYWQNSNKFLIFIPIPTNPISNNADPTSWSPPTQPSPSHPAHHLFDRSPHLNVTKSRIRKCSIWTILMMTLS